jgi:1-phosphofructokinase
VIRTVTLNPALDRTLSVEDFGLDKVNRVGSVKVDAGGKGINVSKALAILGGGSVAYLIAAGNEGDYVVRYLEELEIEARFTKVPGRTRTNVKIVDPVGKTFTDVNEAGPWVDSSALEEFEKELFAEASAGDIFVFSGSAPEGCPRDIYARWIERARRNGARSILDADGELLARGAEAKPDFMKPNEGELDHLVGRVLTDDPSRAAAARGVLGEGCMAAISLGAKGALFVDSKRTIRAWGIEVDAAGTVGAGDTMLAAIALGMEKGLGMEEMVAPAMAAGAAAVEAGGSAAFTLAAVRKLERLARYEEI